MKKLTAPAEIARFWQEFFVCIWGRIFYSWRYKNASSKSCCEYQIGF